MDFISWLVIGTLFMLAEFGVGNFFLLAIGLACVYPSIASYSDASVGIQLAVLSAGIITHSLVVAMLRKLGPSKPSKIIPDDVGQRVEVIEWLDECTATVKYRGKEWQADKVFGEMPDAPHGIIRSVQGNRLIISTELNLPENTNP